MMIMTKQVKSLKIYTISWMLDFQHKVAVREWEGVDTVLIKEYYPPFLHPNNKNLRALEAALTC